MMENNLSKFNEKKKTLKLEKGSFLEKEDESLANLNTISDITPPDRKLIPINEINQPKTLSQLKFFMGSIHKFSGSTRVAQ